MVFINYFRRNQYERLKNLGIPVKITRTTDETLSPTERVERVLDAYGNDSNVIVVSNHINAGGGEGQCVTKYV